MTRVAVAKWGNSTAIRLPKAVVDALKLAPGQTVEMTVEDGKAVITRAPTMKLAPPLSEMVAEMERLGWENEPETVDWGPDVGSERFYDHE
jgi:antitoxin MazE